jgi:hypothetical protein
MLELRIYETIILAAVLVYGVKGDILHAGKELK